MFKKILPYLVFVIYKILYYTWRIERHDPPSLKQDLDLRRTVLLAHWHGDESSLLGISHHYRPATMVSISKDGEMMNTLLHLFGIKTSRGSSHRKSVGALKGLIDIVKKNNCNVSVAVDGPKGPYHQIKPGIFELSKLLKAPIYVCGVAVQNKIEFKKSWNKAYLPLPFSRIILKWEGPFGPLKEDQDPRDIQNAKELNNLFDIASQQALKLIATSKG